MARLYAKHPALLELRHDLFAKTKYEPHREQVLYHESDARFRVPVCGRRFGKSMMAGMDMVPRLFMPDKTFWIIGPTYDLGEKEFRVVWDALIVKLQLGRDKRIKYSYNRRSGTMYMEFPWKTRLEVRSADHPENLVGESLDHVILSEAAKHKIETWERFVRPALTDRRGSADFPTTPEGFNWLHSLWQLGQSKKYPDFESWKFPSWANSVVYPGGRNDPEIKLLESTTTPEWFMQEIGADFASFVGKIFPEWDEMLHVTDVEFNPDWPNYMAFDWGYTNPLAAIEFQISPDDEIYIWREHYKSFTTLNDHIAQLKGRSHPEGYHLDLAFGDPADPDAVETVSRELVPCVSNPKVKSDYTWQDGINLIRTFMKPIDKGLIEVDEYGTPADPQPRYHVDHSCLYTIKEHNNYRSKSPIKGQNVPEFGAKIDDHTIDAVRYALIHIYKLGAISSLADIYKGRSWRPEPRDKYTSSGLEPLTLDSGELGAGFGSLDGMEF